MDSAYLSSNNKSLELQFEPEWQIALVVLYSSTAVLSFASNVLAIFILLRRDRLISELWKYLVNLSIADIFMALFSIPFTYTSFMLGRWIFPNWLCPLVQFAQYLSVFVSVYTLVCIGLDRYFAIIYPFHSWIYLKRHKSRVLIFIWIVGIAVSSVQLVQTTAVALEHGNETFFECKELWDDEEGKVITIVVFVVTFGLPVLALVFVYSSIGVHIIRHTAPGNPDISRDMVQWILKVKVIKMLVIIVVLFVVCWLPIHVHSFVVYFYPNTFQVDSRTGYMIYAWTYFACHWLAMAHSFLNPFIYGFMSENFKISFRKLFCRTYRDSKSEAELEKLSNVTNVVSADRLGSSVKDINY